MAKSRAKKAKAAAAKPASESKTAPKPPKNLGKMEANPKADWTIAQLVTVAERLGLAVRNPGGSHYTFSSPLLAGHLTVPSRRPIKPLYIRNFVGLCRAHMAQQEQEDG